jgi:hypothetical protein
MAYFYSPNYILDCLIEVVDKSALNVEGNLDDSGFLPSENNGPGIS